MFQMMPFRPIHTLTLSSIAFVLCAVGCSKNHKPDPATPDPAKDMAADATMDMSTDLEADADMLKDMVVDTPKDMPTKALPDTCNATCSQSTVEVTYNNQTVAFENATFGLLAATRTSSKTIELQIEAYIGGSPGCPSMNSPTPKQTLIITGIEIPTDKTPITEQTSTIKLIDYDSGLLKDTLFVDAKSLKLTPVASKICTTCLADPQPDPNSFIALDMDVTFDKGSIKGRLYAKHCDSMDAK